MPKEIKRSMAAEVREHLEQSPDLLVVGLLGLDAEANVALRNELRSQGASFRVIHNRSSRFALDEARQGLAEYFRGQTAVALQPRPEPELIPVAKTLVDAAKKKFIEIRGGYVDGDLLDAAGVEALAASPDKPTLRAMMLGAIQGSARGLAVSVQGVAAGIARCLQARVDESGESTSE